MTSSGQSPADSAVIAHLDTVRGHRPAARIELNRETGHWDAVERPTPSCMIVTHAPTLAELDIKLDTESGEAG